MDRAATKPTNKTKITGRRYSISGIAPPGLSPTPNIQFMGEASTLFPENRGTTETASDVSKPPGVERINSRKVRRSITADECFLRDIFNEAKKDPLHQDPSPRTSAGGRNITDHPFPSKVWAPLKDGRSPPPRTEWPKPSEYKRLARKSKLLDAINLRSDELGYKSQNTGGQIIPTTVAPRVGVRAKTTAPVNVLARGSPPLRSSVPGTSSQDLWLPLSSPTNRLAWRPPPEFIPGVPFQSPTKYQNPAPTQTASLAQNPAQLQTPAPIQNTAMIRNHTTNRKPTYSSSFPPESQIGGLCDFPSRYPMHGMIAEVPHFRTEFRYPAFISPQGQHHVGLAWNHASFPDPSNSMHGLTFRPAETANAAIAQLHSSMNASQLRNIAMGSDQNLYNQFVANSGGYAPPGRFLNVNYPGDSFANLAIPDYVDTHYDEHGAYIRKKMKHVKQNDIANQIPPSSNAKQLLNSTRGVYIRGVPPGATLRQVCANIRGGAVDRIKLHANDNKIDAAVYFVQSESARTYKHWSNRVGGIWWSPANHEGAFPSFTAFIGPENGGHDRLKDIVRDAINSEGATRCILVVGLPRSLTEAKVTNDLKMGIYPDVVDIESFSITANNDTQGEAGRSATIKFASIETALSARNVFTKTPTYRGTKVYFAPDDCAGSMQELADRWNREIIGTSDKFREHTTGPS